jgi:hypothetical protein
MQITTCQWTRETGWVFPPASLEAPQFILYFGATEQLAEAAAPVQKLAEKFPPAVVCGCSTGGEILGARVSDESIVAALVHFGSTHVRAVAEPVAGPADSQNAGRLAGEKLSAPDLRHVLVLSDGLAVNGSALVAGLRAAVAPGVAITGGLAGDGKRFQKTLVGLGAELKQNQIVAVGFYGKDLVVGYSSRGGWEGFGPRRRVTRSAGVTLFELDSQPALALYKRYLGERAAGLPAAGLLFPLEITKGIADTTGLVRTILAVDEANQSLTFAGDIPEGAYARLMKASGDQLIGGAAAAARGAGEQAAPGSALAILVSCVGRRWVLGQRTEDELEESLRALPAGTVGIGFYSYGEACPASAGEPSELHNQTMTITCLTERL